MSPIENVVIAGEIDGVPFVVNLPQEKLAFLLSCSCQFTADNQVPIITAPEWLDVRRTAAWVETTAAELVAQENPH